MKSSPAVGREPEDVSVASTRCLEAVLLAPAPTRRPLWRLLDAQAGDGPGDHELLDLLGALEDVEGLASASGRSRNPCR